MIELVYNYIKTAIITGFHIFKDIDEKSSLLIRNMKDIEKTQIIIVEMRTTLSEIKKKKSNGINNRLHTMEEINDCRT